MSLSPKSAISKNKKRAKKFKLAEKVTWAGTIIGLIVDLIAIVQIISLTLNGNVNLSNLNFFIRPQIGIVIWGACFFYLYCFFAFILGKQY